MTPLKHDLDQERDRRRTSRRNPERDRRLINDRRLPDDPDAAVTQLVSHLTDLNRWRGNLDAWRASVDQDRTEDRQELRALRDHMTAGFDRLEAIVDRRMDRQDLELSAIRKQTTATNGRVIQHTEQITVLEERQDTEDQAAAQAAARAQDRKARKLDRFLNAGNAILGGCAGIALTAIAHYLLHLI